MDTDVFLCCADEDQTAADGIRDLLEAKGVRCWFAPLDNPSGSFSLLRKGKAIARSKAFVLLFSKLSAFSNSAECETAFALKMGRPMAVVRLDASPAYGRFRTLLRGLRTLNAFGAPLSERGWEMLAFIQEAEAPVACARDAGVFGADDSPAADAPAGLRGVLSKAFKPVHRVPRFTLAIPAPLAPGAPHLLTICVHVDDRRARVLQSARLFRDNGFLKCIRDLPRDMNRLTRIDIDLSIPDLNVLNAKDMLFWNGKPVTTAMAVEVPAERETGSYPGEIRFTVGGLQIAKLDFTARMGLEDTERGFGVFETEAYRTAFACYAPHDDIAVLTRVYELRRKMPHLEVYLKSPEMLDPAQQTERIERLRAEIVSRDALYLFWSKAASECANVDEEWRLALEALDPDRIVLVPLDSDPPVEKMAVREAPFGRLKRFAQHVWPGTH